LRRFARGESYDVQAMPELDSEALDFRVASELFVPVRKLKRADLETLRLLTIHQGRKERWNLPSVAMREAIINAAAHADYAHRGAPIRLSIFDDRLEMENPGLLPFGLTVDDLRHGISKLRNRVIGRVFHELGLIEQWGSGIQRMTAACSEAGLAVPALEEIGTRFRVTLHVARTRSPAVDTTDQAILNALAGGKGSSTQEIATAIERTPRATRTRLAKLSRPRAGARDRHQPARSEATLLSRTIKRNQNRANKRRCARGKHKGRVGDYS
jgi:predicted HTH transcriptional regulator